MQLTTTEMDLLMWVAFALYVIAIFAAGAVFGLLVRWVYRRATAPSPHRWTYTVDWFVGVAPPRRACRDCGVVQESRCERVSGRVTTYQWVPVTTGSYAKCNKDVPK